MNRFVGNPFFLACCVPLMLWGNLSWAELSATADRRTIAMGETLRLTLLGDAGEQPAEIDLTPLNRDWEILSRSSATNARFINGQNQVTRTLEMELNPLREGTLTIPSLTAGGRSTTPLAIRVNPEPVVAPGDELVVFDASVDKSSVYVQSEVILTVTLQQAINLDGGEISNFDIPDTVVENLERRSFQRRVGNRTWLVTELRYAVYPQKSGALRIPAIGFTAREVQPGRSLLGARLGKRLRMASEPLEITVNSVPTSFPGEVWLPAQALTLEENWSIDPASLNIGDSTTRTLTLTARGLLGTQLPPLSSVQGAVNIPELRFYPDQESIDQSELAEGLQGRRVQSEALVARSGGTWTLPEVRVPWWNTETDRLEFATLPARTVAVTTIQTVDQTNDLTIAPSASPADSTLPLWLWAVSAAGWLVSLALGILLWLSGRHTAGHSPTPGGATAKSGSVRQALVEIRKAAAQEDPVLLRKAILQWADLHHERGFSSLEALARVSTESLATRLRAVDRSLYGDGELASALEGLIDTLREEPAPQSRGMGANTLSLYPS